MNYYPHHIGDFNNATRHLTRVERSLYRDLIDLYFDTEQPLPADDFDRLARRVLAHSDEEKESLKSVLAEFFTLVDGCYHQSRCDEEIHKYQGLKSNASKAGKASAAARSNKKATPVEQPLNKRATNQEPRTKNQEPIHSVPDGTGSDAAERRERTPEESRKADLWRAMKGLLVDSGESKDLKAAGAVITKTITRYDEVTALAAIEATLHARPAGAIAYLEAACQQAIGHRLNKQESLEASNLAAAERFALQE